MKKKRWGIAHWVGIVIAIALMAWLTFGCASPQLAAADEKTSFTYNEAAPAPAPAPARVTPAGEAAGVTLGQPAAALLDFRANYERAWTEGQQDRLHSGLPEDGIITYIYVVHILAIIGIIGILTWIF